MNKLKYLTARRFIAYRVALNIAVILIALCVMIFSVQYGILLIVIGILASILLFPDHPEKDYRTAVIPLLQTYQEYLTAIKHVLLNQFVDITKTRIATEEAMRHSPQWVYQRGFHVRLREGYRHFLVRTEQLGETLFALHAAARHPFNKKFLQKFSEEITFITDQSCRLTQTLTTLVALQKPDFILEDWIDEIVKMENKFQALAPDNMAAFSLQKDNLYLAALIQDFRDLREILLKMVQSIR